MLNTLLEFERKISKYYGLRMKLVALSMDIWYCTNIKDVDNIDLYWEPAINDGL